jgi:OOP family OmpA-OmpF porin
MKLINKYLFLWTCACMAFTVNAESGSGYIATPASGDGIVKTAYGQCVHSAYYNSADGMAECGEAAETLAANTEVATEQPASAPEEPVVVPQPRFQVQRLELNESALSLFAFNSAALTVAGKKELTRIINKAKKNGDLAQIKEVIIAGHTDKIGGEDYNERLSADRASAVKDFLIYNGVDSDKITTIGMGEQDSIVSDRCFKKYAKVSRAEINRITIEEEAGEPLDRRHMDVELSKFAKQYKDLVACTAADRRVKITVMWQARTLIK